MKKKSHNTVGIRLEAPKYSGTSSWRGQSILLLLRNLPLPLSNVGRKPRILWAPHSPLGPWE